MTEARIVEVKTWLQRMDDHSARAIALSTRMSSADTDQSNDLFWALAKYVENVQESVVQLDAVNPRVYPALVELSEPTWKGLKGMRSRLAHAFWNVDPEILLSTVTEDFPNLRALLSTIEVHAKPISDYETVEFTLKTERLLALPDVVPGSGPSPGARIVVLVFGHNGRVGTIRVGHRGGKGPVFSTDFSTRVSVYGR